MKRLLLIALLVCAPAFGQASRTFVTDDFLSIDTALATTYPVSMHCWNLANTYSVNMTFISINDVTSDFFRVYASSTLRMNAQEFNGSGQLAFATNILTGSWQASTGVFTSSTDRSIWHRDTEVNAAVGTTTPLGLDNVAIGAIKRSTPINFWNGNIAHCAMWDASLSNSEAHEIHSGMWPTWVHTDGLVGAWDLMTSGTAIDLTGAGNDLTETSVPGTSESGPPIFFPIGGQ